MGKIIDPNDRLRGEIVVRAKSVRLKREVPATLSKYCFYMDEYIVVESADEFKKTVKELIDSFPADAIPGWIPASKETFEMLSESGAFGISNKNSQKNDDDTVDDSAEKVRYAAIPLTMIEQREGMKMPYQNAWVIGPAKKATAGKPLLHVSVAEQALKSAEHASRMMESLLQRINATLPSDFCCHRIGNAMLTVQLKHGKQSPPMPTAEEVNAYFDALIQKAVSNFVKKPSQRRVKTKKKCALKSMQTKRSKNKAAQMDSTRPDPSADDSDDDYDDEDAECDGETCERVVRDSVPIPERWYKAETQSREALETLFSELTPDERCRRCALEQWLPLDALSLVPGISKIYDAQTPASEIRSTLREQKWGLLLREGAGGVPIQCRQKGLCMMSGGIDSPVAAYRMMCRGINVDSVHYLNSTGNSADIMTKLTLISKRLSKIQGMHTLYVVDIKDLQQIIISEAADIDRTILYKQFMLLISAALPSYDIVITGDSVGQVASQTSANIGTIYPNCGRAIVSPLCGTNKNEVVNDAIRLGLYDFSVMEGADCCQYLTVDKGPVLNIAASRMRHYLANIEVPLLSVQVYCFLNGEEFTKGRTSMTLSFEDIIEANPILSGSTRLRKKTLQKMEAGTLSEFSQREVERRMHAASANSQKTNTAQPVNKTDTSNAKASPPRSTFAREDEEKFLYFDSAAASVLHPAVTQAMVSAPSGNPNTLHAMGRRARSAIEDVRFKLLNFVSPDSNDATKLRCVFTGSGTEANNIAVQGLAPLVAKVLYSVIGHPSVPKVCESLHVNGKRHPVEPIRVTREGLIDLTRLETQLQAVQQSGSSLQSKRCLVCIDMSNHELGTVQRMDEIVALVKKYDGLIHVDCCQALCKVPVDATKFHSTSFSAHKINGPLGVGALVVHASLAENMFRIMQGGSYDGGLRPGTENVPGIVGFGAALDLPREELEIHQRDMFNFLRAGLLKIGLRVNTHSEHNNGHVLHVTIPSGTSLMTAARKKKPLQEADLTSLLSTKYGICLTSGAACSAASAAAAGTTVDKLVYRELGIEGGPTLRISFDFMITLNDCQALLDALKNEIHFS